MVSSPLDPKLARRLPLDVVRNHLLVFLDPSIGMYVEKRGRHGHIHALKVQYLRRWFHSDILEALGGEVKCALFYKFFQATEEMTGGTSYIDRLRPGDLPGLYPVYFAVDMYKRPFVALRYYAHREGASNREVVCTLFQRYTNDKGLWCFGTRYDMSVCPCAGRTVVSSDALKDVHALLTKGKLDKTSVEFSIHA